MLSADPVAGQFIDSTFMIGKWKLVDSSTGQSRKAFFGTHHLRLRSFQHRKWSYQLTVNDSVLHLISRCSAGKVTLVDEAIIIVKDDHTCWWFNPVYYDRYLSAFKSGYATTHPREVYDWVRQHVEFAIKNRTHI